MDSSKLYSNNIVFINEIESLSIKLKIEYIDAVVLWCENNKVEVETVATWIKRDPVLKAKIQFEAENLNFLKRSSRLPL